MLPDLQSPAHVMHHLERGDVIVDQYRTRENSDAIDKNALLTISHRYSLANSIQAPSIVSTETNRLRRIYC